MIAKFRAQITLEFVNENDVPKTDKGWEDLNKSLEEIMEQALENNTIFNIPTAEILMEEL